MCVCVCVCECQDIVLAFVLSCSSTLGFCGQSACRCAGCDQALLRGQALSQHPGHRVQRYGCSLKLIGGIVKHFLCC